MERIEPECPDCKSLRRTVEKILKRLKELEVQVDDLENLNEPSYGANK